MNMNKELEEIRNCVKSLKNDLQSVLNERRMDMAYEKQKMRYEADFNARNIILIIVLMLGLCSQLLFGLFIWRYFDFEKSNVAGHIEVQNASSDQSFLLNSVANGDK